MTVRYQRVPKDRPTLRPHARKHDPEYLARLGASLPSNGILRDYTPITSARRVL